jgi:DNA (cytosine-5)-methyltransferase 1
LAGFSLGLERTGGFETVAFCEIEKFPQRVLKKHWPDVPIYEDVRTLNGQEITDKHGRIDVITGGFPCQDLSLAGKQAGIEAERSGLWSEIARLVSKIRPRYIIVENVANLLSGPSKRPGGWFSRLLGDLASIGYDAEWHCIRASDVGLSHVRDRVWIIAYPLPKRREVLLSNILRKHFTKKFIEEKKTAALDTSRNLRSRFRGRVDGESPFLNGNNGFSNILGGLAGGGNAVVPQIPELIGHAILEREKANDR